MLTKVLLYAYCVGVFSSRKIQRRLSEDIAFRMLAADNQPDFRTISDFRQRHLAALEGLFVQVLHLAREAGALSVGRVAIDGSKVHANASKHKAMSYKRMLEKERQLEQEVHHLLTQAAATDAQEDAQHGRGRRGDELPEELRRRETRLARIREAKRVLEERAKAQAEAEGEDAKAATPEDKAQYNFTDPESRIMKGPDSFVQAYNAQIAVEATCQLIVGQAGDAGGERQAATDADARGGGRAGGRDAPGSAGRQRILLGSEPRVREGSRDRRVHRDRPIEARCGTDTGRSRAAAEDGHPQRPDAPQTPDEGAVRTSIAGAKRSSSRSSARSNRRAASVNFSCEAWRRSAVSGP